MYDLHNPCEDILASDKQRQQIIKSADLHLGVPAVIMEPDNKRKELYGKAGAYRPKPYGVEYRTISNFYLKTRELISWAYNAAKESIEFLNNGNTIDKELGDFIRETINNNDKEAAKYLINTFNLKTI